MRENWNESRQREEAGEAQRGVRGERGGGGVSFDFLSLFASTNVTQVCLQL